MTITVDFASLFERYHKRIYSYVFRRTPDHHVAEDLTADVFLRAIDAFERGLGAREDISSWLYRIAHNRVVDFYKERDRHPLVSLDEISEMPCDHRPEQVYEQHIIRESIEHAALKTTPEQYEVVMAWMTDKSPQEIATEVGKSLGAAKALRIRAFATLRVELSGVFELERVGIQEKTADTLNAICNKLAEAGPMSTRQLASALHVKFVALKYVLDQNRHLFHADSIKGKGNHLYWSLRP